jgi:hypothetical protein
MKKLVVLLMTLLLASGLFAQTLSKMSYQGVIRNSDGQLVTNKSIGIQICILKGSETGSIVYCEFQNAATNSNGLISIKIGSDATFSNIDWSTDDYFIRTEVDLAGSHDYSITGISQLLSVPYAIHAKTAETITGEISETDPIFMAWNKNYNDLTNIPTTFNPTTHNHDWIDISSKPTTISGYGITDAFDGNYNNLTNRPDLFSGSFDDLLNKPTTISGYGITDAFDGNYNNLINRPDLFSGSFDDLFNKPTTISGYGITDVFDGNYNNLTNKPTLFSGSYNDLTNKPVNVTTTTDGFMSSTDKVKLNSLQNANGSETKIVAGTNTTVTGLGTTANPYVINATNTVTEPETEYYLGQELDGGIIFCLYRGNDGQQHGLIVNFYQASSTMAWQSSITLTNAISTWDGVSNTILLVNSSIKTYITNLGAGWYLPSIDELKILWNNRFYVNRALTGTSYTLLSSDNSYWSSTEASLNNALQLNFRVGQIYMDGKPNTYLVRAIRAF